MVACLLGKLIISALLNVASLKQPSGLLLGWSRLLAGAVPMYSEYSEHSVVVDGSNPIHSPDLLRRFQKSLFGPGSIVSVIYPRPYWKYGTSIHSRADNFSTHRGKKVRQTRTEYPL